jgi:hypothetical protein
MMFSSQALAQSLQLRELTYGGTGCPQGTASVLINDAEDEFSVIFDQFIAEQPGSSSDRRKFCALRLLFRVPAGWQFSIAEVQYRGFAELAPGVRGIQSTSYDFPLFTPRQFAQTIIPGPYNGNYDRTDHVALLQWSRCGTDSTLAIDAQVYLAGLRNPPSTMTVDTIDGNVKQIFHYLTRRC